VAVFDMLLRALVDGVIAHPARQSGWFCARTTREFASPAASRAKGGSSAEVMHKEPRSGFGKRLDLIAELILAGGFNEQPKFALPDRHSDRPFDRLRVGKHPGVSGWDLRRGRDQPVAMFADEREPRSVADGNPD
jgi:hypothetical protein